MLSELIMPSAVAQLNASFGTIRPTPTNARTKLRGGQTEKNSKELGQTSQCTRSDLKTEYRCQQTLEDVDCPQPGTMAMTEPNKLMNKH